MFEDPLAVLYVGRSSCNHMFEDPLAVTYVERKTTDSTLLEQNLEI